MSKTAKKTSKLPKVLKVSGRDQEIYQQTAIEGQSQRKVAAEKHISQSRVSKIVQRVELWLGETVPFGFAELPREQRLYMAQRKHRLKLDWMYHQATEAWQASKEPVRSRKEKVIKGEKVEELTVKTQSGNFRLLDEACKIAEKQIVFEGFALDGQVEVSCKGRLFELPAMTDAEMAAALKRDHDLLYPVVMEWEAEQAGKREDEGVSGRGGEGVKDIEASLATGSGSTLEPVAEVFSEGLSEIAADDLENAVTSLPVDATDESETAAEVLSPVLASAEGEGDLRSGVSAGSETRAEPGDVANLGGYQTPLPRYHETSDGFRRPFPWMREVEDPNPKKLPGMWLKHPTCYGKSDNPGAQWEPCG